MMELLFVAVLRFWDSCVSPLRMALPAQGIVADSCSEGSGVSRRSNANSAKEGFEYEVKRQDNYALGLRANTVPSHTNGISENRAPNHDEVRRRAYEIYLERGGVPGKSLRTGFQLSEKSKVQHTL